MSGTSPERRPRGQFQPGNQRGRRHGVWSADIDDEALAVVGKLYDAEDVERYPMPALIGATAWVRRRRALEDIERRGMVLDGEGGPKAHPLLRFVGSWDRLLLDVAARYGLTPRDHAVLVSERAQAQAGVIDLEAVKERGRAAFARRGGDVA